MFLIFFLRKWLKARATRVNVGHRTWATRFHPLLERSMEKNQQNIKKFEKAHIPEADVASPPFVFLFFHTSPPPKLFFPPQISLSLCFLHLLSSFLFRLNKELPKARSFTPSEHSFLITIRELQKQIVCGSLTIFWDL